MVEVFRSHDLMKKSGFVPEEKYTVPIGKGIVRRVGKDLTVVGASHAIELAFQASKKLIEIGIDLEVIDLRSIQPLDDEIIGNSVKKTGRLLVVDTGWAIGGVCAEIGFRAAEKWFSDLKSPVRRIGLPDAPTPAGYGLEQFFYPTADNIAEVVREMCLKG